MRSTASTPSVAQLFGAFALAALGTALVMATDLLLPNVTQSGLQHNAVRLAILAVILYGAWRALTRAQFSGRARLTAWLAIAVPLLVWQSVVWWLALGPVPLLPLAIVLPLLIGLPILLNSNTIGQMLDATPPSWLVGLQVYRVFGSVFLTGWLAGDLPAISAVPAGAGDTLVGLLALSVAAALRRGQGRAWPAALPVTRAGQRQPPRAPGRGGPEPQAPAAAVGLGPQTVARGQRGLGRTAGRGATHAALVVVLAASTWDQRLRWT